ncbi:MAG: hypothetical protein IJ300_12975 [Clostridia bacterium]|nr:hypothetical protein [Clostridia bacterium]
MADISTLPTYETRSFARWVARATVAYFENPDVKRRFEEWKKEKLNGIGGERREDMENG